MRSREYDSSDKEDINPSKDVQGTKTIDKNSSTDETNVENKITADNSVKIALPDPRPVVAPRQFVEHKTLQSTQLNQY